MKRQGPTAVELEAKLARHRKWNWCRLWNGFTGMTVWRVVADELQLPVFQIVAFATRLEELANASEPRGCVADFSAADFAVALGMSRDDARRIFEALKGIETAWIDGEHLATFHKRNPDREDVDAAERQRKVRWRREVSDRLEGLFTNKRISQAALWQVKTRLPDLHHDTLQELVHHLRKGRDLAGFRISANSLLVTPETMSQCDVVADETTSHCDSVTVTTRAESHHIKADVDNSGDGARGEEKGPPKGESAAAPIVPSTAAVASASHAEKLSTNDERLAAVRWLEGEGLRIVTERMVIHRTKASTFLERWGRDLDDPMALVAIVLGADGADLRGPRFHVSITDQVDRALRARAQGLALPLPPVPIGPATRVAPKEQPVSVAKTDEGPATAPLRKLAG